MHDNYLSHFYPMSFGIKTSAADKLFSKLVREKGNYICVRCQRKHRKDENTCDTSHYWTRSFKSVRFDFDNADVLCKIPCHAGRNSNDPANFGWEYQKQIKGHNGCAEDGEYTKFKKKQLGKMFEELMIRAHTPQRVDEKSLAMGFKLILKRMEAEKKSQIIGAR